MKFTISYVFADRPGEYNTSNFRMIMPGRALGRAGYGVSAIPIQLFQEHTKEAEEVLEKSQIIVVERNLIGDVLTRLMYWKVRGKVIILNWDDAYHCIEETNVSYPYWKSGSIKVNENGMEKTLNLFPHPYEQFKWGVRIGHASTLPSQNLVDYWSSETPTYLVRNYFETQHYLNINPEPRESIILGWGGSVSHFQSFRDSGILDALTNVCRVKSNVKVMICGDTRVYDKIPVPDDKKIFQPYVSYEAWGGIIAKKFDIGIVPLAGEYDTYRSWIKPLELMLTQKPWIATNNGITYRELLDAGYGNFTENGVDNWTNALLKTIDNLENERQKAYGEPFEFAKKQDIDLNAEVIADTYREIAKEHAMIDFYGNDPIAYYPS